MRVWRVGAGAGVDFFLVGFFVAFFEKKGVFQILTNFEVLDLKSKRSFVFYFFDFFVI